MKNENLMKKTILLILTTIHFASAQTVQQEQYQFNQLAINPAFAGAKGNFNLTALLGNQFNGSFRPQQISQILSIDGAVRDGKGGLGIQAFNDRSNFYPNSLGLTTQYAHRINIGELFSVAIGLQGGFINQNINFVNTFKFYYGGGVLLQTKGFFLGLSQPVIGHQNPVFFIKNKPFYSSLGMSFGDVEGTMLNTSAMLISGDNKGFHLNAKAWFKQKFGAGISYRSENKNNKIIAMAEYQLSPSVRVGASYDSKPFDNYQINIGSGQSLQARPVIQLLFKYELLQDEQVNNRLRFF
jgi:hypothetical protein